MIKLSSHFLSIFFRTPSFSEQDPSAVVATALYQQDETDESIEGKRHISNTIEHFMRDRIDPNSGYFPVQIAGAEVHNVPHMLDLQNAAVHCSLFTVLICSDWLDNLYFFHFRLISNRIFQVYQERRGLLWEKSHVGSDI